MGWAKNILETIGHTPLVQLNRVAAEFPFPVLAKVEFFNPGGSVKDRIGIAMIEAAEREGKLKPGGVIIEGTSGNTGAGLALAAIARGYRCIFTTTDKQSQEKIDVLRALGVEVIVCPTNVAPEDPRSYYSVARRLAEEIPNAFYVNQYDNPANPEAHYRTTGPELWEQTEGRITHFIAGAGTGGTISGTSRYLKEKNPAIKTIGVDPYGSVYYKYWHTREFDPSEIYPYITEGVGEDILAGNMDFDLVDDYVRVTDKESMLMTRRLAREEGLFVGGSSGMAVAGALQWLRAHRDELTPDSVVVVLLPDTGFRYLSKIYNDTWMKDHGFIEEEPPLLARELLAQKRSSLPLIYATPDERLIDVIARMNEYGISQIPVLEGTEVVGSLTEKAILKQLLHEPHAEERRVAHAMAEPFPVVSEDIPLENLAAYFDNGTPAVLVEVTSSEEEDVPYRILTRSDLIRVLAEQHGN